MSRRRHGRKPTIALWMLVAVADVALLVATGGLVALVLIGVSLAIIAGGFVAGRQLFAQQKSNRLAVARKKVTPAEAVARHRA